MIELLILFIIQEESCNIYRLKKQIEEQFSIFANGSFGSIYPALKKLENSNFVTCKHKLTKGGQRKSIYSITQTGKTYYQELLQEDFDNKSSIEAFQLLKIKLIMIDNAPIEIKREVIQNILFFLETEKNKLAKIISTESANNNILKTLLKQNLHKITADAQWISTLIN